MIFVNLFDLLYTSSRRIIRTFDELYFILPDYTSFRRIICHFAELFVTMALLSEWKSRAILLSYKNV